MPGHWERTTPLRYLLRFPRPLSTPGTVGAKSLAIVPLVHCLPRPSGFDSRPSPRFVSTQQALRHHRPPAASSPFTGVRCPLPVARCPLFVVLASFLLLLLSSHPTHPITLHSPLPFANRHNGRPHQPQGVQGNGVACRIRP